MEKIDSMATSEEASNSPSEDDAKEVSSAVPVDSRRRLSQVTSETQTSGNGSDDVNEKKPPRALGCRQVGALFRKNMLTKYRTPVPTFFEIFSPVLMMLILVAAYTLSDIKYRDAKMYATINLDVPGPWLRLIRRSADLLNTGPDNDELDTVSRRSLNAVLESPKYAHSITHDWDIDDLFLKKRRAEDVSSRNLQQTFTEDDDDDDSVDGVNATDSGAEGTFAVLNDAQREIKRLLRNPIAVPTFSQYVQISQILSSFIDADSLPRILSESSYGRQWGSLLTLGTLHLSPNTTRTRDFWAYLNDTYPTLMETVVRVRLHETEDAALRFINSNLLERAWALLHFPTQDDRQDIEEEEFRYKIRMNYTTLPNTNQIVNYVSIGLDTTYQRYYTSGYLTLQQTLNEFAFSQIDSDRCNETEGIPELMSMPMPTAAYSQNAFFQAVGYLLGLTIAMAFLYPVSRLIKSMVEEKETRMKETLFILGVRPWAHWLSWLLTSALIYLIISVLVTWTLSSNVLKYSSPSYLFAFIGLFSSASVGFSFFIAAFFSKAKLAAIVGPIALFATLLPRFIFFGSNRYEASTAKMWASLLPCTAFAFGADIVADYEYAEQGIQSWNASEGDYSFNTTLGFLFIDTFIFLFLGWYVDLVIPREYGAARKWYFLFLPGYWASLFPCFNSGSTRRKESTIIGMHLPGDNNAPTNDNDSDIEPVSDPSLIPRVQIQHLVKRYTKKDDSPPAVDDLNLTFYESQISCLLGHNGSGKTTTISVLTGLYPPTSGDCIVYGNSITQNPIDARQSIGICPQHDILFDRLTVLEHLTFFQRIKGMKPARHDVREQAVAIGLGDYLCTTSVALSGGNKRKLSLAISLCGDPDCLLLDEPTSGMDAASRRACWELLRKKRTGRVTVLTTHYMEEAEILGDRITILKEGKLQCCGSALFLKNKFGLGYNLTIVFDGNTDTESQAADPRDTADLRRSSFLVSNHVTDQLLTFVRDSIPDTKLVRTSGREVTLRFPHGSEQEFPALFDSLEQEKDRLRIKAYGISNATLEEVFLQLAGQETASQSSSLESDSQEQSLDGDESLSDIETELPARDVDARCPQGLFRQVSLLYRKRYTNQRRDVKGACFMIVVPVLLIGLVLLVLMIDIPLAGSAIEVSMGLYGTSPSGGAAVTDVLVGGGASIDDVTTRAQMTTELFANLSSVLRDEYPAAEFALRPQSNSSKALSEYLLRTYNDRGHNPRYGAFILRDIVKRNITVDWDGLRDELPDTIGPLSLILGVLNDTSLNENFEFNENGTVTSIFGFDLDLLPFAPPGTTVLEEDVEAFASILHNSSSPHAVAAFNQAYIEYLYKVCSSAPSQARLVSVNHPLPLTEQQTIEIKYILSVLASLFLLIPFCYIPAAFIVFLVKERVCKSKHLQLVSGVKMSSYWASSYLFDLTLYSLLTILTMLVFLMYGKESAEVFVGDAESFFATMSLIFGYGMSGLPFAYLLSRMFSNHSSAQIAVLGIFFITGFVAVNAYFIMISIETTESVAESLRPIFRTWPAYNLGNGFIEMSNAYWEREILNEDKRPFQWDVAGKSIFLVYILALPYSVLLLMLEYSADGGSGGFLGRWLRRLRGSLESLSLRWHGIRKTENGATFLLDDGVAENENRRSEDADVKEEREYVAQHRNALQNSASVLFVNLWKVYPPSLGMFESCIASIRRLFWFLFCCGCCRRRGGEEEEDERKARMPKRAVRGLTTAITEGETYGLLGANGAGKTTTLGILTGDISPTGGAAFVAGHDVTGRIPGGVSAARNNIGFCPQVNPLLDLMTGRETLTFFARLRGVPNQHLASTVTKLLERLTLTPYADKTADSYSGGNKRKLSLGVALIGDPQVILIDEASSGMDPESRRHVWELLKQVSKKHSIVLTTHIMEEAEALCTRVGIMVNGILVCLGSVQHLKSFVEGYLLQVHCRPGAPESKIDQVIQQITQESFVGSKLVERHGRFLRFEISTSVGLGLTFRTLESLKDDNDLQVETYSISQCSLEQVFLKMVQQSDSVALETA